jgi:hypothetical protein
VAQARDEGKGQSQPQPQDDEPPPAYEDVVRSDAQIIAALTARADEWSERMSDRNPPVVEGLSEAEIESAAAQWRELIAAGDRLRNEILATEDSVGLDQRGALAAASARLGALLSEVERLAGRLFQSAASPLRSSTSGGSAASSLLDEPPADLRELRVRRLREILTRSNAAPAVIERVDGLSDAGLAALLPDPGARLEATGLVPEPTGQEAAPRNDPRDRFDADLPRRPRPTGIAELRARVLEIPEDGLEFEVDPARPDGDCLFYSLVQSAAAQLPGHPLASLGQAGAASQDVVQSLRNDLADRYEQDPERFASATLGADTATLLLTDLDLRALGTILIEAGESVDRAALGPTEAWLVGKQRVHQRRILLARAGADAGARELVNNLPAFAVDLLAGPPPALSDEEFSDWYGSAAQAGELRLRLAELLRSNPWHIFSLVARHLDESMRAVAPRIFELIALTGELPRFSTLLGLAIRHTEFWNTAIGDNVPPVVAALLDMEITVVQDQLPTQGLNPSGRERLFLMRSENHYDALILRGGRHTEAEPETTAEASSEAAASEVALSAVELPEAALPETAPPEAAAEVSPVAQSERPAPVAIERSATVPLPAGQVGESDEYLSELALLAGSALDAAAAAASPVLVIAEASALGQAQGVAAAVSALVELESLLRGTSTRPEVYAAKASPRRALAHPRPAARVLIRAGTTPEEQRAAARPVRRPQIAGAADSSVIAWLRTLLADGSDLNTVSLSVTFSVQAGARLRSRSWDEGRHGEVWLEFKLPDASTERARYVPVNRARGAPGQDGQVRFERAGATAPTVTHTATVSAAALLRGLRRLFVLHGSDYDAVTHNSTTVMRRVYQSMTGEQVPGDSEGANVPFDLDLAVHNRQRVLSAPRTPTRPGPGRANGAPRGTVTGSLVYVRGGRWAPFAQYLAGGEDGTGPQPRVTKVLDPVLWRVSDEVLRQEGADGVLWTLALNRRLVVEVVASGFWLRRRSPGQTGAGTDAAAERIRRLDPLPGGPIVWLDLDVTAAELKQFLKQIRSSRLARGTLRVLGRPSRQQVDVLTRVAEEFGLVADWSESGSA